MHPACAVCLQSSLLLGVEACRLKIRSLSTAQVKISSHICC